VIDDDMVKQYLFYSRFDSKNLDWLYSPPGAVQSRFAETRFAETLTLTLTLNPNP